MQPLSDNSRIDASRQTRDLLAKHRVLTGFNRFMNFAHLAIGINIIASLAFPTKDWIAIYILAPTSVLLAIGQWLFKKDHTLLAKLLTALALMASFILISFHIGREGGTHFYFFPFILAYIYLFRSEGRPVFVWAFTVLGVAGMAVCVVMVPEHPTHFKIPVDELHQIFLLSFFVGHALTIYFFFVIYTYQEQLYQRVLDLEHENRARQLQSVIQSHENTKQELMLELRDNINQTLSAARMFIEKGLTETNQNPFVSRSRELTNEAIRTLSMLCIKLHPALVTDVGLQEGVRDFLEQSKKISPINVRFDCQGSGIESIQDKKKLDIFRIIQDYLILLIRHSSATHATIELNYAHPMVTISFRQDDPHFNIWEAGQPFMYTDMHNRIAYYKGSVRRRGEGTDSAAVIEFNMN